MYREELTILTALLESEVVALIRSAARRASGGWFPEPLDAQQAVVDPIRLALETVSGTPGS